MDWRPIIFETCQELLRQHLEECHGKIGEAYVAGISYVPEDDPPTRLSGTMEPEHPKACDHPCHKYPQDIGVEPWLWKVCPMGCGLPLKEKEEKP